MVLTILLVWGRYCMAAMDQEEAQSHISLADFADIDRESCCIDASVVHWYMTASAHLKRLSRQNIYIQDCGMQRPVSHGHQ